MEVYHVTVDHTLTLTLTLTLTPFFHSWPGAGMSGSVSSAGHSILHADRHIVVVVKPPGIDVHGRGPDDPGTLVALVASELRISPRALHPASRLDRPVSGVVPLARSKLARRSLTQQYQERQVHRTYVALAAGVPDPRSGRWDEPVRADVPRGGRAARAADQPAITDYVVIRDLAAGCSLIELRPVTGRTHQLRVHLSRLGRCPVLGDRRYGGPSGVTLDSGSVLGVPRVMLHARVISLRHPATGETLRIEAPLLDDMQRLLDSLMLTA